MTRLKIGGVPEHFNLPWRLAIQEGLFEKINVKVHWSDMPGGTGQMVKGLMNESIDIAVLLTEGITKAILDGLPAKILSFYVDSPLRWGIHVPRDSPIKTPSDLAEKKFAISRHGSGSHLMTFIEAKKHNWDINKLTFNVVGDIYGGLWALENNKADAFLWEKFTTRPFVKKEKCNFIGEVVTPWPCFVIAARKNIVENKKNELNQLIEVVRKRALELKNDPLAVDKISWRYHLDKSDVETWLDETNWSNTNEIVLHHFESVISFLQKAKLINEKDSSNYLKKLF